MSTFPTIPGLSRAQLNAQLKQMLAVAENAGRDFTVAEADAFEAVKAQRDATPLILGSKAELEDVLQAAGLPKKAAKAVASGGWFALSKEQEASDLAAALQSRVAKFTKSIRSTK